MATHLQIPSIPTVFIHRCHHQLQNFQSSIPKVYISQKISTILIFQHNLSVFIIVLLRFLQFYIKFQAENITYDPKTGFSFYASELSQCGEYICRFTWKDQEHEIDYFVRMDRKSVGYLWRCASFFFSCFLFSVLS